MCAGVLMCAGVSMFAGVLTDWKSEPYSDGCVTFYTILVFKGD